MRERCGVVDSVIANSSLYTQVHRVSTGYADSNSAVQNDTMYDASADLLANRTDCEPDSALNFDALLLGGYFAHVCLPTNCKYGGKGTNIAWKGYRCDNDYRITLKTETDRRELTHWQEPLRHLASSSSSFVIRRSRRDTL